MRRVVSVGAAMIVLLTGCHRSTEVHPQAQTASIDYAAEARAALGRQDYSLAAVHLRAVLAAEPESVFAHYSLAVCASYLGRLDEATAEFRWVVQHAPRASEEQRLARQWLAERDRTDGGGGPATESVVGAASVRGLAIWPPAAGTTPVPRARLQLHLIGLRGTPTQGLTHMLRTDATGHYAFTNVVPGAYRLVDVIAGAPKWRLKVILQPGQDLSLDLTPDNGLKARDDFPDAARG